ncbi:MAG: ATP-binding cassette domain-containing protein [Atopobiaceae bacterium]|nr:ATP-binding cassette domain-containing protein [Atopobiaceae bacterium]
MYLEVMGLKKSYGTGEGRQEILRGVDLSMERGTTASIVGSSGCGKSTLLNCIGALEVFDEGDIQIDGKSLKNLKAHERVQIFGVTTLAISSSSSICCQI